MNAYNETYDQNKRKCLIKKKTHTFFCMTLFKKVMKLQVFLKFYFFLIST